MFNIFKKNKKNEPNIVVLQKPPKNACGGTTKTLDKNAPKEITCDKMTYFSVTSALSYSPNGEAQLGYISAFAVPSDNGTFLFLEAAEGHRKLGTTKKWAKVKADIFPVLVKLVLEYIKLICVSLTITNRYSR